MSDETRKMLTQTLESVRETMGELWDLIDRNNAGETNDEGDALTYEGSDPMEYLDEWPLEIVWETGEPFAVVLGTGGPHYEVTGGGRQGGYVLTGYWGGEEVTLSGQGVTRTGEYFREQVEGQ